MPPPENRKPGNRLRIIGGQWRSRVLGFADREGLRPTPDRVRETLFNWLRDVVAGARCLDAFAGSGALGFEALSRGAASVVALEVDAGAGEAITANCRQLQTAGLRLVQQDALQWLRENRENLRFDIVFLDPPFAARLHGECCRLLHAHEWLAPGALVYLESDAPLDTLMLPDGWELIRHKRAGAVYYGLCSTSR